MYARLDDTFNTMWQRRIRHLILSGFLMGGRPLSAPTCTTDPVTLDTLSLLLLRIETPDPPTALRILSTLPFSSNHLRTVVIHRTHLAARFCAQLDGAIAALKDVTLELEMSAITGDGPDPESTILNGLKPSPGSLVNRFADALDSQLGIGWKSQPSQWLFRFSSCLAVSYRYLGNDTRFSLLRAQTTLTTGGSEYDSGNWARLRGPDYPTSKRRSLALMRMCLALMSQSPQVRLEPEPLSRHLWIIPPVCRHKDD
ncbi:hypothetical protein DFH08DRAFT_932534 [Mycena albidolilacea]|uniref:Uncharacterized protein n=1 Tax=Mycena albidolilacea TaxID=1033008 RepID=A0AAD7EZK9_9AGAR|nr:hypothetical protein DFH08DRAFT_932534 [Mycena albidolilacea]